MVVDNKCSLTVENESTAILKGNVIRAGLG